MAIVEFDYAAWAALFPVLAAGGADSAVATQFFAIAGQLLDNSDDSLVSDATQRLVYLNYATAHLVNLAGYPLPSAGSTPQVRDAVGRTSSATEGSVSASLDYGQVRENQAWWLQTQYGATFWQLTRALRTFRYRPAPARYFGPAYGAAWPVR